MVQTDVPADLLELDTLVCKVAIRCGATSGPLVRDSWQYAEGWVGLLRARRSFDPARGDFRVHAWVVVRQHIMRVLRDRCALKRRGKLLPLSRLGGMAAKEAGTPAFETAEACRYYLGRLQPRARRLVRKVIMGGVPASQVARSMGLSKSTVCLQVRRALADLRRLIA